MAFTEGAEDLFDWTMKHTCHTPTSMHCICHPSPYKHSKLLSSMRANSWLKPFAHGDFAISPKWRLIFTAPFCCSHQTAPGIWSCSSVSLQNYGTGEQQEVCQYTSKCWGVYVFLFCFFGGCFPEFSPVNLNVYLPTLFNYMNAVIKCCDEDPDPPCIVESDRKKLTLSSSWGLMGVIFGSM